MLDYLAVAFRHPTGSWAAVMPDFIGITGRGSDASAAIAEAKAGAGTMLSVLKEIPTSIPRPMNILAAQCSPILAKAHGVDWSTAVVDTVSLEAEPELGDAWGDLPSGPRRGTASQVTCRKNEIGEHAANDREMTTGHRA